MKQALIIIIKCPVLTMNDDSPKLLQIFWPDISSQASF